MQHSFLIINLLDYMENTFVGVAVVIEQGGNILLTLRKAGDNVGTWELPAGHIEEGESPEETAAREVLEETGLIVNDFEQIEAYGITCILRGTIDGGELANTEPDQHEAVQWWPLANLPQPLGPSAQRYAAMKKGKRL